MLRNSSRAQVIAAVAWLAITFVAAAVGSIASLDAPAFYGQLSKPAWAPPPGVFGPVWTLLYLLMAGAAWLVWRERADRRVDGALGLYLVQLGVNALWSWLFFAWHRGALALADILLLLVLVVGTLTAFWRIRRLAGLLLLPYLAWILFATALNGAIWQRNPGIL